MILSSILTFFYLAIALWFIAKHRIFRLFKGSREAFIALFLLKLLAAFALTAVYTFYYTDRATADIFKYFDDAQVIYQQLPHSPQNYLRIMFGIDCDVPHLKSILDHTNYWFKEFDYRLYNDNRTIIRLNALIMLFSFGHFAVHNVFLSFMSFMGLYGVFRVFYERAKHKRWWLLGAVFCVPGVLFWGSGVLKESFLLFLLGCFLFLFQQWCCFKQVSIRKSFIIVLLMVVLLLLLSITKYYVLICALPSLLFLGLAWRLHLSRKQGLLVLLASFAVCLLGVILNQCYFHFYDILETLSLKHNDFVAMAQSLPNTGSLVENFALQPRLVSFIEHTPGAFSKSFLQPFPWQIHSVPMILSAAENILLLVLFFLLLRYYDKKIGYQPIAIFGICFTLVLFWLNGLITPVLGALVRYKVPALPFLYATLVLYIDFDRMNLIKRFRNK